MKKIGLIVFLFIAFLALLPVIMIVGLIYIIISIVFQPYFYKRDRKAFNEAYHKARKEGRFIGYPPKFGHLFGPGSGMFDYYNKIPYPEEYEDTDELE